MSVGAGNRTGAQPPDTVNGQPAMRYLINKAFRTAEMVFLKCSTFVLASVAGSQSRLQWGAQSVTVVLDGGGNYTVPFPTALTNTAVVVVASGNPAIVVTARTAANFTVQGTPGASVLIDYIVVGV